MLNNKLKSISIFYPCFNEEKNIPIFVNQALKVLPQIALRYEIIIVNDGSRDNTLKVAQKIAADNSVVKIVNHKQNRGYGAALKSGFKASKFDWVFFTDGDLQFDLKQLIDFLPFTSKYSVIIGYRKTRAEGFQRALNAKILKITMNILYRLHVRDIDCAYKLIKKDALENIKLVSEGAFLSSELLYRLKKKGYKFKEICVNHYPRKFGNPTGNNIKVMIRGIKETFMLYLFMKFNLFSKHYGSSIKDQDIVVSKS